MAGTHSSIVTKFEKVMYPNNRTNAFSNFLITIPEKLNVYIK